MTNVNHAYCPQKKLRVSINLASDMEGRGQVDPAGLGVLVLHLISGTWLGEIAISANHMPKMWVTKFWGAGRGLYTTVALTLPGLNSQSARQQKNPLTVLLPGDIMASVHNSLIWLQKHYDASEQRIQVSGEGGGRPWFIRRFEWHGHSFDYETHMYILSSNPGWAGCLSSRLCIDSAPHRS